MDDQKRSRDAEDEAPKPTPDRGSPRESTKQDAPNYEDRTDQGKAIPAGDVNSANDE